MQYIISQKIREDKFSCTLLSSSVSPLLFISEVQKKYNISTILHKFIPKARERLKCKLKYSFSSLIEQEPIQQWLTWTKNYITKRPAYIEPAYTRI